MNNFRLTSRVCLRVIPLMLVLALTACGGGSAKPKKTEEKPRVEKPAEDPNAIKLAYGVSFRVPEGWKIDSMISPDQATPAVLEQRVAAGERVPLVTLHRPADTPEGKNGIAAIFLVDADRDVFPRRELQGATPEGLQQVAQNFLKRDKEQARQAKAESNLLSWQLIKGEKDGKLTLTNLGDAKRPGGRLKIYDITMYLESGKGIGVKTLTDPAIPGNDAQLKDFVDSVRTTTR